MTNVFVEMAGNCYTCLKSAIQLLQIALELWNLGTSELWNFGTLELWNFGTLELWNLVTWELENLGT